MNSSTKTSACWLLPDLGHYHHSRIQAAAAVGPAYVLEIHDRPGFPEFRYVPGSDANYKVERVRQSVEQSLDELRPDVVFLNGWAEPGALAGLRWCQRTATPTVVMSESTRHDSISDHDSDPGRPVQRRWWKEKVKRQLVRQFSAALVGGTPHREYIVELGMPPERVFDGYDVVDTSYYRDGSDDARRNDVELRGRFQLPRLYFLASARFIAKKNLPRLIRAFADYRKQAGAGAWDLVLLGDGPDKPAVVQAIADCGVHTSVHLPGFRSFAELPHYYGLGSAFIHASTTEQWGLVVNEAMAAALPVIVSNRCGCAQDLVSDGLTGFRFDPFDTAALTRFMLAVAAPDFDREKMGQAARARISEWGPPRFAQNFWRAADAAIKSGAPKQRLASRLLLSMLVK